MHVPDGFFDGPTSIAAAGASGAVVVAALKRSADELAEKQAPLAGLTAAFIFAVQMLNFPVAAGTSGHLIGGALAAVLLGPWTACLCLTVVLVVQALMFADGGLSALGINVLLMGVVAPIVATVVFRAALRLLRRRARGVPLAAGIAAFASVPAAAMVFALAFQVGGTIDIAFGRVMASMVGVHVLIGIGEAVITAATVGAVVAVRPDLVAGARGLAVEARSVPSPLPVAG